VEKEEEYLVGIFGEDYVDYMAKIPRFVPWR
jgi:protein-S-isoprenylcysteine O-methyltransferase Ste14